MSKTKEYVEQRNSSYYIAGTRVSLDSIVHEFRNGASPETIGENFETLTLEQVYGAIAYYLAHQDEIDSYLQHQERAFEEARRNQSHITPQLRQKLERGRRQLVNRRA